MRILGRAAKVGATVLVVLFSLVLSGSAAYASYGPPPPPPHPPGIGVSRRQSIERRSGFVGHGLRRLRSVYTRLRRVDLLDASLRF